MRVLSACVCVVRKRERFYPIAVELDNPWSATVCSLNVLKSLKEEEEEVEKR